MSPPFAAVAMLACACVLTLPAGALAQDPAAEVPDVTVSEAQAVTTGPSYGVAGVSSTAQLWATVNICDTATNPNSMGVRASMPGNGTDQKMYMRFRAEYWSRSRQAWTPVAGTGVSPWVYAGSAEYARRQAGWTFLFAAPPAGVTFTMRSQVEFQWRAQASEAAKRGLKRTKRRKGKRYAKAMRFELVLARASRGQRVVRALTKTTVTGITGVHGGDPVGASKAMCLIY